MHDNERKTTSLQQLEASRLQRELELPDWRQFELQVSRLLEDLDATATVEVDVRLPGRISRTRRQVNDFVQGTAAGSEISVAIECKHFSTKKIGIGDIDQFDGKLRDLGVDRGVFYSTADFTVPARNRADGSVQPRIEWRSLAVPYDSVADVPDYDELLFQCANPNCYSGDVRWKTLCAATTPDRLLLGTCVLCGTMMVRCDYCEDVVGIDTFATPCLCDKTTYEGMFDRKGSDIEGVARMIDSTEDHFDRDYAPNCPAI